MKTMKKLTAGKPDQDILVVARGLPRLHRPIQRPAVFRSGKVYSRRQGKRIDS